MAETTTVSTERESTLGETIERVSGIVSRGRWWILGSACFIPIAVIAVALKLADRYVSQATLLVVQQQVSQRYVEPDSSSTIPAAVQAMKLEVLSRDRLLGIIHDLGLYARERPMPDLLVDKMRQDIDIQPLETSPGRVDFNAITISFTAESAQLAQQVTSRLTSLFIEQNLRTRGEQAANTTKFLSDQLDAAKRRLAEQEQRLQAFKTNNLGELPEQQQANLAALAGVREHLEVVNSNLLQAQQQQSSLEMSLSDRLARLQSERTLLLAQYTERYPEVVKKDGEIAKVQGVLTRLKTSTPSSARGDTGSTDDIALDTILRQAEANTAQIATLSRQQEQLRSESEQYEKRLNLAPLREQQLGEISRDYDLYKQEYTDLLNKTLQSQMSASVEENQEGQQFRLVDSPNLPAKPVGPKRLSIALGGLGGGILLGLALAFLMDMRDSSFHSEEMLRNSFSLPLLMGVPLVRTSSERRARAWRIGFEWLAGCVMTLAMFVAEFYVFKNR